MINISCSIPGHSSNIEIVCTNQFCKEFRLSCFDCLKNGRHLSHINDQIKLVDLPNFFKLSNQKCKALLNNLEQKKNAIINQFNVLLEGFQTKYLIPLENIFQIEGHKLNNLVENLLDFNQSIEQIDNSISESTQVFIKTLENSLQNQYLQSFIIRKSEDDQREELYKLVKQLMSNEQYQIALEFLEQSIVNNQETLLLKADCLREMGEYKKSMKHYDLVLDIDSFNVQSYWGLGECLRQQEHYEKAIEFYSQSLIINPNHVDSLSSKGFCLAKMKNYSEGLALIERALKTDKNHLNSINRKGHCLYHLDMIKEAELWFDKALKIDKNNTFALHYKNIIQQK
ncbi:unnamed protein product [Paramecium pentaurelia]|uniref:Tetratricopeptide repeat protein n=1 Tax=Paramecium pentaurelia TaxID=43138 RepID=A0A8S1YKH0_9CILI|nr:unnamed protein product [Paramecium pentaurelia]